MSADYTIRWVLTHEPIALFEEAARRFTEIVREESDGRIDVHVMTPTEYGDGTRVPPLEVARRVASGELEMSQTYTTVLGQLHERLWALDLPFLFASHDHAASVLDGEIGHEFLDGLRDHGLRGLAFTYSGGYRILSSVERSIHGIDDIAGLRIRTSANPVVVDLFERLGAMPRPAALWEIPELTARGEIDAAESTWPRYWDMGHRGSQPVVADTGHSLFLTALVVNETFFAGLPERLRAVVASAALRVARFERRKSVRDGDAAKAEAIGSGMTVTDLDSAERARFVAAARATRERFLPTFGAELIERIEAAALQPVG